LSSYDLEAEVRGELIIVTEPITGFFAVYGKKPGPPQLLLKDRARTDDHALLAAAFQAAVSKARELKWMV
jgi:hypothetical protein